jgi:AraC family transcriptional regulator of adaptative response/methylated-DNA-[protein]-cysteine methyltransferase
VVGLSPKAYQGAQRMARFAAALKRGETVTNATYDAGFGSSSRLYAHVHEELGMTPSAFRSGGRGVTLRYTTVPTPVGLMLVAMTRRGIVAASFGDSEVALVASLQHDFPKAVIRRDTKGLARHVSCLLRCLNGRADVDRLQLDIRATTFHRKVWQALQQIPRGQTRSYREIARAIGQPTAARAVAKACAGNPVAMAIPCHRAVRSDGRLAGYRWGLERKQRLLALERT